MKENIAVSLRSGTTLDIDTTTTAASMESIEWLVMAILGESHNRFPRGGMQVYDAITQETGHVVRSCADSATLATALLQYISFQRVAAKEEGR